MIYFYLLSVLRVDNKSHHVKRNFSFVLCIFTFFFTLFQLLKAHIPLRHYCSHHQSIINQSSVCLMALSQVCGSCDARVTSALLLTPVPTAFEDSKCRKWRRAVSHSR